MVPGELFMSGVFSPTRAKIKERTLRTDKWWYTIRWPDYRKKIIKYASFLPNDVVKYKLLLKKII
jgi:hypothetical protein